MSDLLDLYKSGAFSKDEEQVQEPKQDQEQSQERKGEGGEGYALLKLLSDLEAGRNFFNEYINIILQKKRQELVNKDFTLDDLYAPNKEEDVSRKERERKFITERKNDFIKYVDIINQFVKVLNGQNE